MAEAGNVSTRDLVRAEWVSVGASVRWVGDDPLTGGRVHQLAEDARSLSSLGIGTLLQGDLRTMGCRRELDGPAVLLLLLDR